jgi:hypothetical protein
MNAATRYRGWQTNNHQVSARCVQCINYLICQQLPMVPASKSYTRVLLSVRPLWVCSGESQPFRLATPVRFCLRYSSLPQALTRGDVLSLAYFGGRWWNLSNCGRSSLMLLQKYSWAKPLVFLSFSATPCMYKSWRSLGKRDRSSFELGSMTLTHQYLEIFSTSYL